MTARRKIASVAVALVTAGAGIAYAALVSLSSLPLRVIDRDSSGLVSFGEAIDAHDVGSRPSEQKPSCVEFYWLKDGTQADRSIASRLMLPLNSGVRHGGSMIGHGENRTRFFVAYGYSVVAARVVLSQALIELVSGESAKEWLIGLAAAILVSVVPGWLARYVPGPIWLTPVVLGIGTGLAMFPALGFIFSALR